MYPEAIQLNHILASNLSSRWVRKHKNNFAFVKVVLTNFSIILKHFDTIKTYQNVNIVTTFKYSFESINSAISFLIFFCFVILVISYYNRRVIRYNRISAPVCFHYIFIIFYTPYVTYSSYFVYIMSMFHRVHVSSCFAMFQCELNAVFCCFFCIFDLRDSYFLFKILLRLPALLISLVSLLTHPYF